MIVAETESHRYLPWSGVWWDAPAAEVTDDPVTRELRERYEKEQEAQRLHY